MKKLISILQNIKFIFMPHYWIMNEHYDEAWDKELNYLLDNYDFKPIRHCIASLNYILIWVENYPYACFSLYDYGEGMGHFRPARQTIYSANKILGNRRIPEKSETYTEWIK